MIHIFISTLIGILAVFPFFISFCLYVFARWSGRPFSMRKNADYTTPFLFLSVYIIAHTLIGDGVGYVLLIVAILMMIIFAIYEKRRVKDFNVGMLLRKVWRFYFIVLVFAYILLIISGLILAVIHAVN